MPDSLINVNGDSVQTLEILFLTTVIALLPSMLIMMTSFTRIIISLSFLRTAMGTSQNPPNTVLVGIALFLTLFIMNPVLTQIQQTAYEPYTRQEITQEEAIDRASVPLKEFMLRNTESSSLTLFCDLAGVDKPATDEEAMELSMRVIIPSYMTSELKAAFQIGFFLYIPFMLIDIVVSSTLMSMGMIMLPPAMISMPFKTVAVYHSGWLAAFVLYAGAGLPIVRERRLSVGSEPDYRYSTGGDMGCAQNWRTNADCQYGSWCSGGNFSGGNADSRTNAVFYSEAFVNHRVSPPCRQLDAEYDAGFYKDDIHPNDCLEGRGQRAR